MSPPTRPELLQAGPIFACRFRHEPAPRPAFVTHEHAGLSFYAGGASRIEQRARWTIEAGDVHVVPAGEPHRWIDSRAPEVWSLGLSAACLATEEALLDPFERVRDGASPVVRIPEARRPFLAQLFEELHATTPSPADALVRLSLTTLILNEVSRAARWTEPQAKRVDVVAESLRFIERHCLGPLSVDEVAAATGRTASHVSTALKRATGRSAVEWIIAGRMAEARRRLLHSDEHVDVIAERVGYADATHFIRLFRRAHGVTPAAWRARAHT